MFENFRWLLLLLLYLVGFMGCHGIHNCHGLFPTSLHNSWSCYDRYLALYSGCGIIMGIWNYGLVHGIIELWNIRDYGKNNIDLCFSFGGQSDSNVRQTGVTLLLFRFCLSDYHIESITSAPYTDMNLMHPVLSLKGYILWTNLWINLLTSLIIGTLEFIWWKPWVLYFVSGSSGTWWNTILLDLL